MHNICSVEKSELYITIKHYRFIGLCITNKFLRKY